MSKANHRIAVSIQPHPSDPNHTILRFALSGSSDPGWTIAFRNGVKDPEDLRMVVNDLAHGLVFTTTHDK